ncbi:MAG: heavy metal translocating P-type ATPase [Betaproteobacteria bacterium]|nr:heavy metal translocating P-type ATPase [Betaproteobacteria bacterium]
MNAPEVACFHCGQPVPPELTLAVVVNGRSEPMCCHGCRAVASAIVDNGLADYYRHRTALPSGPQEVIPEALRDLALYDHPEIQKSFVVDLAEPEGPVREAVLILEGITCAACIWLNERHLMQLPGVQSVQVNYGTHRARVRWDDAAIKLSRILAEIRLLGYKAHPYSAQTSEELRRKARRLDLRRLAVAGLCAVQVMMMAVALYSGAIHGMERSTRDLLRWVSFGLTLPVMLYSAVPFYSGAWSALRAQRLNMDVPVVVALIAGFLGSAWWTIRGGGTVYYDTVTMFVLFLLSTRFLERGANERSLDAAENLLRLAPALATRVVHGEQTVVPVADLVAGDTILAKPGETIAVDGVVLEGKSNADESLLTGESRPVAKVPGDKVIAGAINQDGPLLMRVDGAGEHTVLAGIVRMLDRAQAEKPRVAELADRVAGYFTAGLLVIVAATAIAWWLLDPAKMFPITLAVLVVTCPCALSLAAPAALAAGGSFLLRRGVLLTKGHALETLSRVNHVVFDKTGTLTYGRPSLQATIPLGRLDAGQCLRIAGALEQASEHPLARAFLKDLDGQSRLPVEDARNIPGEGVSGLVAGTLYRLGNAAVLEGGMSPALPSDCAPPGSSIVWLVAGREVLAAFVLSDEVRPDAQALIGKLAADGIRVSVLSGDDEAAVRHLADALGIAGVYAALRPEGKLGQLQRLQAAGDIVAMVGDGVNDAPVLAAAQVSFAMGGGTQVARSSADIVLLSDHLMEIASAIEVGRGTMSVMKENLAWAVGYNLVAVPFAIMGYLAPWLAALGMSASSLIVVLNALRLRGTPQGN